mgnify:CR=1 FL=1
MMKYKPQRKVQIKWSPKFAYAIGLLTADGSLSSDKRHIYFVSIDLELIRNLKLALILKNKICERIKRDKKHFYIQFGDIMFYKFLNSIGLYSAKSKTIKKVTIPNKLFSDFLRGLFDGDGTFYSYWDKRWPNSFVYHIVFASASFNFINWLKTRASNLYKVKGFIRKGDGVYILRYVKGDSRKLFNVMYYNKNILYLKRKYTKIKNAINMPS